MNRTRSPISKNLNRNAEEWPEAVPAFAFIRDTGLVTEVPAKGQQSTPYQTYYQ